MFGFPDAASGIFVTGTSMANLMGVLVARSARLGPSVRQRGLSDRGAGLTAYTSVAAHGCIAKAMDLAGFGTDALRRIPVDRCHRIDVDALRAQVAADRAAGLKPFLVIGSAGTVDIGAIDDLAALHGAVPRRETLAACRRRITARSGSCRRRWRLGSPESRAPTRSPSISINGDRCPMTRASCSYATASSIAERSRRRRRICAGRRAGLAAGSPWPCDFGPDLSRGFRALKTWFTLKTYGTEKLGAMIARTCALARCLEAKIAAEPRLELLAPVQLNIVCFRYRADDADRVNARYRRIASASRESRRRPRPCSTAGSRSARRSSIIAPECATSTRWYQRCWNSARAKRSRRPPSLPKRRAKSQTDLAMSGASRFRPALLAWLSA